MAQPCKHKGLSLKNKQTNKQPLAATTVKIHGKELLSTTCGSPAQVSVQVLLFVIGRVKESTLHEFGNERFFFLLVITVKDS